MNPVFRRTWLLVALLAGTMAVDVAVHLDEGVAREELPSIPRIDPALVTRLRFSKGDTVVEIGRDGESWRITSPIEQTADGAAIESLLRTLADGVPMDVRVGTGDYETYGLAAPDVVRVDVEGEAGPLTSFYVGNDAAGGSSFVRFAASEDVYRARLGGRHRFDRSPGAWRDLRILSVDPALVQSLEIDVANERYELVHEPAGWTVADRPEIHVDATDATETAAALARLRGIEIVSADHPSGTDEPVATVRVHLADGDDQVLAFGQTPEGAFVKASGADAIFRVPPALVERLARPATAWRDRALVSVDAGTLDRVALVDGSVTIVARRTAGGWDVTEPDPLDVDEDRLAQAVGFLASLRTDGWVDKSADEAGFPSNERFEIGEPPVVVEIGRIDGDYRYVRVGEAIGALRATTIAQLEGVFGR